MNGYIQVYTGNGKGKTTAALGLCLRAIGAGLTVFVAQFIKRGDYSEIKALGAFPDKIHIEQFGLGRFIRRNPAPEDIAAAEKGLGRVRAAMGSGCYDVVVMDEANCALAAGLFSETDLLAVMDEKPAAVELVITGRGALPAVIKRADLVTEMKEIKHYYQQGVGARIGIEK